MILEYASYKNFGYWPRDLKPKSSKWILVACDDCRNIRTVRRYTYRSLCKSCIQKGNTYSLGYTLTEEHKAKISAAMKGNTHAIGCKRSEATNALMHMNHTYLKGERHHNFGRRASIETKALMSVAKKGDKHPNYGKRGEEASNYKGGKEVANAKRDAKRRGLGHKLITPLAEGEDAHHFTDEHIVSIPIEVHEKFSGHTRQKHRTLVLQWLKMHDKKKYIKVLCVLAKE